jgi:hypothetical protein
VLLLAQSVTDAELSHDCVPRLVMVVASLATCRLRPELPRQTDKLIVSTSAGGVTDLAARIEAHITAKTGQPVVIDNRAGASAPASPWTRSRRRRPAATRWRRKHRQHRDRPT